MLDLRVCAACLATDVRMFSMSATSLLQPYQLLSGIQFQSEDEMPQKLCWECAALVHKFSLFRQKCEKAYLLLRDIYNQHDEITEDLVHEIDRVQHKLSSTYIITEAYNLQHKSSKKGNKKSKTPEKHKINGKNKLDFEVKLVDSIKLEDDCEVPPDKPIDIDSLTKLADNATDDNKQESESDELKVDVEAPKPEIEHVKLEIDVEDLTESFDEMNTESFEEEVPKLSLRKAGLRKKNGKKIPEFKPTEIILTQEQAREIYVQRKNSTKFKRAKFQCMLCYMTYRDNKSYDKHMLKHDPVNGKYECDICKVRLGTRTALRLHVGLQHTKKFICNLCPRVSYTKKLARLHYKVHLNKSKQKKTRSTFSVFSEKKSGSRRRNKKSAPRDTFECVKVNLTQEQMCELVRERQYNENYKASRYKCTFCFRGYNEDKAFSNHMRQHHPSSGKYECDLCKIRCKERRLIYKHISNNHATKYTCKICSFVCFNRTLGKKHHRWHKGVVYTCHICGFTTPHETTHMSHLRTQHPAHHKHICAVCGESFVSRKGLLQHNNKMHSVKQDTPTSDGPGPYCSECDIQFSSMQAWTKHILISPKHELEKRNITNGCHYCGARFETKPELKRHYEAEHKRFKREYKPAKEFPFKCAECDQTMVSGGKYWIHFRQEHPGKRFPLTKSMYICEHCGKWFKNKSSLGIHAKYHLEPTYHCTKCPIKFKSVTALATHALSHSDSGQFACDVCDRHFALKRNLTNHFRTHTVEKPHVCDWCGKTFAYDCNLKKHELTVHCPAPAPSSSHHM